MAASRRIIRSPVINGKPPPNAVGRSCGPPERRRIDWQATQALAGRGKHGVGNGRRNRRGSRLAYAAGRCETADDVDVDLRRLVETKDAVAVEVALVDAAAFDRDLAVECRGEAEDCAALHLRPHG